jgi:hypothetical protein
LTAQQLDLPTWIARAVPGPSVALNRPLEFTVTLVLLCTPQYVPAGSEVW